MNNKKEKLKSAFSLVELSIVLLVIGIVLAGITQSSRLIRQFQISTARTLTESSPVNSIPDLVLWLDALTEESTIGANSLSDLEDGDEVLQWRSIASTSELKTLTTITGDAPAFAEEGINGLPSLLFDNSNAGQILTSENFALNNEITYFIVLEKTDQGSGPFPAVTPFSMRNSTNDEDTYINLNIIDETNVASSNFINFESGATGASTAGADSAFELEDPLLISASHSISGSGARLYIDGQSQDSSIYNSVDSDDGFIIRVISVGGHAVDGTRVMDGYIGEVILYNRVLKTEERQAIENYLIKKWKL